MRLVVRQSNEDLSDPDAETVSVEETLLSASRDDWEDFYYEFALFRPNTDGDIPIYESMWKHFVLPNMTLERDSLMHSVLLYNAIESKVVNLNPDRIACESLEHPGDVAVVEDIASAYDIPVDTVQRVEPPSHVFASMTAFFGLLPFLLDQVLSLLFRPFVSIPDSVDTIFVPAIGRFESMRPVIDATEMTYAIVATPLTSIWYLMSPDPEMEEYDALPLNLFTSIKMLFRELRTCIVIFGYQEALRKHLVTELDEMLREELDVVMPTALEFSLVQLHRTSVYRRLLVGPLIENVIHRLGAEQVAIGTESVLGRSILASSNRMGCTPYQIPHSIATEYIAPIETERTLFLASDLPNCHFERNVPERATDNQDAIVPAGRPYLVELDEWVTDAESQRNYDGLRVVIATQTHDDTIREEFLENTLHAARLIRDSIEQDVEVVVKIHPNESLSFYEEQQFPEDLQVTITDESLNQNLYDGDIVFTVNSNVGLESIIAGTPCVCFNFRNPLLYDALYATEGPVPILRSSEDVIEYFTEFSIERLQTLQHCQEQFVREMFPLNSDVAHTIANKMASDLRDSSQPSLSDGQ